MAVKFFIQNSSEYSCGFDKASDMWSGAGTLVPSLCTTFDDPHGSVMSASVATAHGAFKLFTVEPGVKYVWEFEYRTAHTITCQVVDVTNGRLLLDSIHSAPSTPHWSNFFYTETVASASTQLRLYIQGATAVQYPVHVDNVVFQGNAIMRDPELGAPYSYPDNSQRHIMQDGSVRVDKTPRRINIDLTFPVLEHDQFTRLQDFVNDGIETWFSDQAVPNGKDTAFLYTEVSDDYTDTTNNKAYTAGAQTLPAWATLFESGKYGAVEYEAADYLAIDADDSNYAYAFCVNTNDYEFHKFTIDLTQLTSLSEVQSLDVLYKGESTFTQGEQNGVKLYLWDGYTWTEVDSAYSSEKSTLNFYTSKPSLAQRFIYESGGNLYIKALVRTVNKAGIGVTNASILWSYYFRTIVNENLSTTITLKDKAVLSSVNDVVSVKNLTDGTVLALGTNYRVSEDRQSVVVSGETVGDEIEVNYARYWHVIPTGFSENRISALDATEPERSVTLTLEGISTV